MGQSGSKSSSAVKIDTSLAVSALAQQVMNCATSTLVSQDFTLVGNFNSVEVRQVQAVQFSSDCSVSANNMSSLQNDISNALQQAANAQSASLLSVLGGSTSSAITDIASDVKQNITQSTVQNIVNNTIASQRIFISGDSNLAKISQEQTLDFALANSQKVINELESVNKLNTALAQTATAISSNPVSEILDSIFSGLTNLSAVYSVVLIVVVIVGGYIGYTVIQGGFLGSILGFGNDSSDNLGPAPLAPGDVIDTGVGKNVEI